MISCSPCRTTCRLLSPRIVARLLLGFAVLLWGTAYKLSLYPSSGNGPVSAQEHIPQAKLLTERERPARTARLSLSTVALSREILSAAGIAALVAIVPELLCAFDVSASNPPRFPRCRAHDSGLSFFCSLPPPAPTSSPLLS
jgi:hypothetical protein